MQNTRKLKNAHKEKRAFVFGNGPSMQKLNPVKIQRYQNQGFHIIAVNNFLYSDFASVIKPDYFVFSDPLDFVDVHDNHPRAKRARNGKIEKQKVIDAKIPMFVPIHFYDVHDYGNTFYFCDVENIFANNVMDICKPRGYLSWTGMKALAIACYLGYEQIFICGMDYDMFRTLRVDSNNKIYWEVSHFYEDNKRPKYVIEKSNSFSTGEVLYMAHLNLKIHEKFRGFPIKNLDPNGLVDAFSKKHTLDVYKDKFN